VRTKVFLQESIDPSSVENSVRWKLNDSTLTVMMKKPGEEWSMAALGMDVVAPKAIDEEFAKAVAAATAGIAMTAPAPVQATVALPEDKPTVEVKPAAERNSKPVAEKDIPVLT